MSEHDDHQVLGDVTVPKPFAFVLMPFGAEFDDIYELGIKAACECVGAYCERVDEQLFEESILQRIFNQIAKADVVIADMTGRNPNVYYETGYAHALGKRVVLCTQSAEDIPFDLTHYSHIVYEGSIRTLRDRLETRVAWVVEHPKEPFKAAAPALYYSVGGNRIENGANLIIAERFDEETRSLRRTFQLDIRNDSGHTVSSDPFQLALITAHYTGPSAVVLEDGRYLHVLPPFSQIFPEAWATVSVNLVPADGVQHEILTASGVPGVFQEVTELGRTDYSVTLGLSDEHKLQRANINKHQVD